MVLAAHVNKIYLVLYAMRIKSVELRFVVAFPLAECISV